MQEEQWIALKFAEKAARLGAWAQELVNMDKAKKAGKNDPASGPRRKELENSIYTGIHLEV